MRFVSPESVKLSRAYFTDLDRVTYSQVAWSEDDLEGLRASLMRKLKLLVLVKGHVVIATSHLLESELAHEILLPHPRLFSEGVIVPALRSEFRGFDEFLDAKIAETKEADRYTGSGSRDMAQMLDSFASMAIHWQVDQTADWFKQRLVYDLQDQQGLLRSCLRAKGVIVPHTIADEIAQVPRLARRDVYRLAEQTHDKQLWEILCTYADFIYYLSGARAVWSEGVLPQENLMDFSLGDLAGGRTRLSEMQVFFKVFVDLVKTATQTHFPVDLLDALSVEDVLDLHQVGTQDWFVEKYTCIQERTKEGLNIHDPERLVLLMDELQEYERTLHDEFSAAIQKELPAYARERRAEEANEFLNAVASLIVPYWGAPGDVKEILVSGMRFVGRSKAAKAMERKTERCLATFDRILDSRDMEAKPVLLAFLQKIKTVYSKKMLRME